jgi:15-cis-phytoene synthase
VDRAALVAHAQESIAKGSRSFAVASKLFDKPTRERAWLLYSWCRKCDDIADGQDHGGPLSQVEDPKERLAFLTSMTDRALAGEVTCDPAFDALGLVVQECAIPHLWPRDLIAGFAMDADDFSPRNTDDLLRYCYHVAGVVGLMMAVVMGVDPTDEATLVRACDLGLAFQLANIARDIGEDADAGRCYIPATWLGKGDIPPGEHMKPPYRKAMADIGAHFAEMAAAYEVSARVGASRLPFRARWAVLAAAGIYGDIAREVARRGQGAWDHRVFTSGAAKLGWIAKALVQTQRASKGVSHEGLWTPNLKRLSAPSSAP